MGEQKQSKIKQAEKLLDQNGVQQKWEDYFKFVVTMENGDKGNALAKKAEYPHAVGANVSYEIEIRGDYTNIKKVKNLDQQSNYKKGSGKYSGETPEERKKRQYFIIAQSSISNAIELKDVDPVKLFETADKIYNYVLSKGESESDLIEADNKTIDAMVSYINSNNIDNIVKVIKSLWKYKPTNDLINKISNAIVKND